MPKANKLLFIVSLTIAVAVIFMAVFFIFKINNSRVKNTHHYYTLERYLEIQSQVHDRMYILIGDIRNRCQNKPEDIKLYVDYVENLHKEVIILGNDNRLIKITINTNNPESLQWITERLIWVIQPIDEISNGKANVLIFMMTSEIEYLHGSLRCLAGDKFVESLEQVKIFTKKFQK
jgi:hypothetical protein